MTDTKQLINTNIAASEALPPPKKIKALLPASERSIANVLQSRKVIGAILDNKDSRIFAVVGPCSIHDPKAALEYAAKLKKLAESYKRYRRYQGRLTKLRQKAANPANVPKVVTLLAQINGILKDIDDHTDLILAEIKKEGNKLVKPNSHLIN